MCSFFCIFQVGLIQEQMGDRWESEHIELLLDISKKCHGLSGRSLRKLPLLAHAWFIRTDSVGFEKFLIALDGAIDKHSIDTLAIGRNHKKSK